MNFIAIMTLVYYINFYNSKQLIIKGSIMLKENIQKALNQQLNLELYSSYEYLSMSAFFETLNFSGFASWMKLQSQEEYTHAMKFYDYLLLAGGKVEFTEIYAPTTGFKTHKDVFEAAYKHEQKVTESINKIVDLALKENDHATNNFMQWFVTEQVEEESNSLKILEKLRMIDSKGGLFYLDHELSKRGK
jgi:ferritin